jgi:hypothetical protein
LLIEGLLVVMKLPQIARKEESEPLLRVDD